MAKNQPSKIVSKKHLARLQRERQQARTITFVTVGVVAAVVLLTAYGLLSPKILPLFQGGQPVASVNGEEISTNSFISHVKLTRQQMINQYIQYYQYAQMLGIDPTSNSSFSTMLTQIQTQLDDPATLGETVLNQMVDSEIIRQEAKKRGITITSEEVDKAIQDAFGFFPNGSPTPSLTPTTIVYATLNATEKALTFQSPTPTPSPTSPNSSTSTPEPSATPTATFEPTFTPDLSATPTPIPPTATPYTLKGFQDQYQQAVDNYKKFGFADTDLRKIFEDNLLRDKLYAQITKAVPHALEEVWARHILVTDEATAKKVRDELSQGGDWSVLALKYSTDSGSKSTGGDLGWFPKGQMVTEFEDAAFSLKIGEISQPVKTTYGFHIIQVIGHEERPVNSDEYKTQTDKFFTDWVAGIRATYDVKLFDYYKARIPVVPTLQDALSSTPQ
jgi:parvulin-like peptidyl-prolyl isomerase